MNTVLGLSMTPNAVGWVLADGQSGDGATLAGDEFAVQPRTGGVDAVNASEQATAVVLRVQTMVETQGERLRGIGVTWSADAVTEAALLVESLTDAGFDNVVPVRFHQAAESLTADAEAQLALARGAALALEPEAEFNDAEFNNVFTDLQPDNHTERVRSRMLSYTGAVTMLVAGVVTFVISLSIALSLQLTPTKESQPVHQVAKAPAPPIAHTVVPAAPAVAPLPVHAPEIPAEAPEEPVAFESTSEAPVVDDGAVAPSDESPAPAPQE